MILQLPKWMCDELGRQAEGEAIQYMIKNIVKEYIRSEEGRIMRERIRMKLEGKKNKSSSRNK